MKRTINQNMFGIRNSKSITLAVITVLILIVFPSGNVGAYEVELIWENAYGGMQDDFAEDVLVTADGSVVVVGSTYSFGAGNSDVYLLKTDANGIQVWDKTFGTSEYEFGNAFRLTSDNGLVIAGWKSHEPWINYAKLLLIKADLDGNEIWTKDFTYDTGIYANSVLETLDGGYVAVGSCYISNSSKVGLLRTDSAGNKVWLKVYDSPLSYAEIATHIEQTPDGGFILCGRESYNTGRGFLLKTDPNNDLQWREIYFNNSQGLVFTCVRLTTDGNYIVSGYTRWNYDYDGYIAKIDQEGNMLWSREYDLESLSELFTGIIETDTDEYVVCGYIKNQSKAFCLKINSFGNVVWKKVLDNAINARALIKENDRTFYVTGKTESFSAGNEDVYLAKIQEPVVSTPLLYGEPNQLLFVSLIDYNKPNIQTAVIYNQGIGTLDWHIQEDCDWLDVTPTSGSSIGDINKIEISIDTTGLDIGTYTYDVQVIDHNAANSPYIIKVELIIHGYIVTVPDEFDTIQEAIDAAYDGVTVVVADGTYTGDGNRDIDFKGKAITVKSENGPENCIIDCNGTLNDPHRGFELFRNQDIKCIIDGFTIINGYTWDWGGGGGIYCQGGRLTISNCKISNNTSISARGSSGGGILVTDGIYLINNCTITGNSASNGGGISCYRSSSTITNCTISGNTAYWGEGGGIYCGGGGDVVISNCTISNNSASRGRGGGISCYRSFLTINNCVITGNSADENGGGVRCYDSNSTIINCIISGNSAESGGGICCSGGGDVVISNCTISSNSAGEDGGGIYNWQSCSPTITNCTFVGNSSLDGSTLACDSHQKRYPSSVELSNCILWDGGDEISNHDGSTITVSYSNIQGGWEGEGNIDVDPCFIEAGFWDANGTPDIWYDDFWVEGDYHLRLESLCIDAGDPCYVPGANETDLDGFARVFGGRIDMGVYEFSYIEARLRVFPEVINRHSGMKRIMAWVHLPRDISKEQVDEDWLVLLYYPDATEPIEPTRQYVLQHGRGRGKSTYVLAYYDKAELMEAVGENRTVELEVMGRLKSGQYFRGCDSVRINGRRGRWQHWFGR